MAKIAKEWVKNRNCNVCVVDWRRIASDSSLVIHEEYEEVATINTVLTKNAIHRFMKFLGENGMDVAKVSIAGHRYGNAFTY